MSDSAPSSRYLQRGKRQQQVAEDDHEDQAGVGAAASGMAKRWGRRASSAMASSEGVCSSTTSSLSATTVTISPGSTAATISPIALPPSPVPDVGGSAAAARLPRRIERNPPKRPAGVSLGEMLPTPSAPSASNFGQALPSPFSPTKRLRAMTLRSSSLNPSCAPQPSGGGGAPTGASGGILPTASHRIQRALDLYELHKQMKQDAADAPEAVGSAVGSSSARTSRFATTRENGAPLPSLSFETVLRHEFPNISPTELQLMLEAADEHDRAEAKRRAVVDASFSAAERKQLTALFHAIDVDESGSISRDEFLEIAAIAKLSKRELGLAFDATVGSARRRSARTPGGSRELTYEGFKQLVQDLDEHMLKSIREAIRHVLPRRGRHDDMLVFDNGEEQLWRLVPGGRTLVRKQVKVERVDDPARRP